jgi:hypothetical protein
MTGIEQVFKLSAPRAITRQRIWFAIAVAVVTDGIQFGLGPFGWILVDQGLDVLAMILISWAIGFHMLLLPTFLIEFIPGPDMLPTWTACTAAVIMLRRKNQANPPIDIASEVTVESSERSATQNSGIHAVPPKLPRSEMNKSG